MPMSMSTWIPLGGTISADKCFAFGTKRSKKTFNIVDIFDDANRCYHTIKAGGIFIFIEVKNNAIV